MAEPPPGVSSRRPGLPASIDEVVAAAMAKDPVERLASPRHMVTAAAISLGERIPAPLREGARPTPARRRPSFSLPPLPRQGARQRPALRRPSFSLPPLPALRSQAVTAAVVAGVALAATLGFLLARSGSDTVGVESSGAVAAQREQAALRRQAGALLERLDARRVSLRRNLAAARTRGGQLAEARRVQETYRTASGALPRAGAPAAIVGPALSGAERAYARLAAAIRSGDRDEYADAGAAVLQAEEAIDSAIARLNRGGA